MIVLKVIVRKVAAVKALRKDRVQVVGRREIAKAGEARTAAVKAAGANEASGATTAEAGIVAASKVRPKSISKN